MHAADPYSAHEVYGLKQEAFHDIQHGEEQLAHEVTHPTQHEAFYDHYPTYSDEYAAYDMPFDSEAHWYA